MALGREAFRQALRRAGEIVMAGTEVPRMFVETGDLAPSVNASPPCTAHRWPVTDRSWRGFGYARREFPTEEQREDAVPCLRGGYQVIHELTWEDVGIQTTEGRYVSGIEYTNEPERSDPVYTYSAAFAEIPVQENWWEAESITAAYHRPQLILDAQRRVLDAATMADQAYENLDVVGIYRALRRLRESHEEIPAEYRPAVMQHLSQIGCTAANWLSLPYGGSAEYLEFLIATRREARRRVVRASEPVRSELAEELFAPAAVAVNESAER